MQKQRHDLFAADHRRQKITQFTNVLDALVGLVDWAALTKVVNLRRWVTLDTQGASAAWAKGEIPPQNEAYRRWKHKKPRFPAEKMRRPRSTMKLRVFRSSHYYAG